VKVTVSQVKKYCIKEVESLDTVNVFLEDFRPGVGRIVIEVFGESWASSWTGMGERDMATFFCSCNSQYLIGKLAPMLESRIRSDSGMVDHLKLRIREHRREDMITKENARKWYKMAEDVPDDANSDCLAYSEFPVCDLLGDEWWYDLPMIPNHKYEYLKRIVDVVQEALKETP